MRATVEKAVRALFVEIPAWTWGVYLATFGERPADRASGVALIGAALLALLLSALWVRDASPRDRVIRSERRRERYRRDPEARKGAFDAKGDDPETLEARADAEAVVAEAAARKTLAGASDADLRAALAAPYPDAAFAAAVVEQRWEQAIARSVDVRHAGGAPFEADWPAICAALDEAWSRANPPTDARR